MNIADKIVVCAVALASVPAVAAAQDLERGRSKSAECIACHGPDGITPNPTFPNISGQNAAYLGRQLQNFKSGERYHALMTPVARSLTEREIHDLAAYFSSVGSGGAAREPRARR